MVASFQLELEHLISCEAPRSTILSSVEGTNVPSLCTFLNILSGNGPDYDFDDINYNDPPCMCHHTDIEVLPKEAPRLTLPDQSPRNHVAYLQEKEDRLRARQVDLEATEAELECQRRDLAWQQTVHPLGNDDDAHMGAPSGLCFPCVVYNMATTACCLEDISDMPDPKTVDEI